MPYFVYHIVTHADTGKKTLTHLETFGDFKSARTLARERRATLEPGSSEDYRLIFAKNETEAEKLLSAPREERVVGED
ncbi:MAG: hypothetical protein P8106_08035 [Gammaproteobacteria bacterium]|jgi:hypothetical protein